MAKRNSGNHRLTAKELDKYKKLLLEKRQELLGDVSSMEETVFQEGGELSSMPVHMADVGTDSYEQEFSLGLMAEGKKILAEIDRALLRIEDGSYGVCEGLGTPIERNRLEAIPWTRYSLECARRNEKGRLHQNLRYRSADIDRPGDGDPENDRIEQDEEADIDEAEIELPDTGESFDDDQAEVDEPQA